ncbi:MAG TPA: hypothetical protein VKB02_10895 [Pyrinomonadaceae bacterium]|nr:hypothetical protein [Pyrinomonadaceae bacterium]
MDRQTEDFRHSLNEIVLCHRGVDLDGVQSEARCLLAEDLGEHTVALEQVTQGPFRVAGPREKSRRRSAPTLDHCLTEVRHRQEPDGMSRCGEERLNEAWQQSESLDDNGRLTSVAVEIFDDHVEALALKPVKRLEHGFRRSIQPSLIEVHRHKLVQQRRVFACAPAGVIRHHVVCRVNTQTVLRGYATGDGRFACTTSAADPVDVLEI